MATAAVAHPTDALHSEPSTLYHYLELKDGGIVQTYPGTVFEKRRKHVPHEVDIKDLRPVRSEFSLDENGFQLVDFSPKEKTFLDEAHVEQEYYPECSNLIKKLTGASYVHPVSYLCRRHTFTDAQGDALAKEDTDFVTKHNPAVWLNG